MMLSELLETELIEVGRTAIEDELIERREHRLSFIGSGNGFVVREADGTPSSLIRMTTADGLLLALRAMLRHKGIEA